jgi:hypothetical protein
MDFLADAFYTLCDTRLLRSFGFSKGRIVVPFLQYADDTIFFVEGSMDEARALHHMINIFGELSSLRLNRDKSSLVCFGLSEEEQGALVVVLMSPRISLPIRYLGLPLRCTRMKKRDWSYLFDKITVKLDGWHSSLLSKGGRLILLNSVITSIPVFYFSIF